MSVGLTLGKFAPLHRGHQWLIETAIEENDQVVVMVYDCPETTAVPLPVRAGWIRKLYPGVEVIEARNGPREVGATAEIMRRQEDYILQTLRGRKIDAFYSSEFYGDHVSKALGAADRRIDSERTRFPVSGTDVRDHPFAHRHHLHPVVYRDLVTKVVFLGAPSTGKTTLARRMAEELTTAWMPEYGREYWELHQVERRLSERQLVEIAERHLEREEELVQRSDRFLFVDTDARTTRIFSLYYHGAVHPRLDALAKGAEDRYGLVFLCGDDIPYDDTADRSGALSRNWMQDAVRKDLQDRRTPFVEVKGSPDERVQQVRAALTPG